MRVLHVRDGLLVLVGAVVTLALMTTSAVPAGAVARAASRTTSTRGATGAASRPFRGTNDLAVSGYGDGEGYHVQVAKESDGFAWQDVAVLRPAGLDEASWYGYQCLAGDGRHVAVTVLPGGLVNLPAARLRGAYAYAVDLTTGASTPLLSGVSFQYSSPGCGAGSDAAFTASLDDDQAVTSVAVVDLATGAVGQRSVVAGQVTSAVPVGDHVVGALGSGLVSIAPGGSDTEPAAPTFLADVAGQAYDVHPSADGGVDLLSAAVGAGTATVSHWDGATLARWATGPALGLRLDAGRGGHNNVVGVTSGDVPSGHLRSLPAGKLGASAGTVSLDGDGVFAPTAEAPDEDGQPLSQVMSTSTQDVLTAGQVSTGPPAPVQTGTSDQSLPGVELNTPLPSQDQFVTSDVVKVPGVGGGRGALASAVPAAVAATQTPKCGVPRLDPARQAMQPSPAQVDWAVQMAEQGLLTGTAYTRPANFANMGLAAYAPSSDFPRISLHHPTGSTWDTVPRSVMEAVMAQESNFDQASWHALPGIAGAPLIGDYYGAKGSVRTIDYANADCGYGIAQVTTGMAASETSITVNGKAKVGVDYEENIAAGLRILQQAWNALYDAGATANNGDPKYLENWYMAIWAYNSGIQPTAAFGNTTGCTPSATCTGPDGTWGLGWSNNPINPSYPPNRAPYLQSTYADAAHPADWPYQERVMGWMASPIIRLSHAAYAKPDYHGGQTWLQLPARTTFCTRANLCDPTYVDPANPAHTLCTLADYECWWHQPATWVTSCATTCATSTYAFTTGSTEPTYSSPHPPTCNVDASKLPTTANGAPIIVDEIPNPALNRQGCGGMNWSSAGTFSMAYGTSAAGDPTGQIDTHQLGAGFGGHILFTHTQAAGDTAVVNTGTWTPTLPSLQYYKVKIHIPATGAAATDVVYVINPGGGASPWKIRVNQAWGSEQWVTIGTFAMQNGGNVQLSNVSAMAAGVYDVAYDAIAFLPQGGTPGQPIGGPPTVQDAPKGSNPAWVNCGCVRRTAGDPVDTATGYFGEVFADLATPGRGAALSLTRSYAASVADPAGPNAASAVDGPFGHGWSFSYGMSTTTNATTGGVVVRQEDGSQVAFTAAAGVFTPASPRMDATLTSASGKYTFVRRGGDRFVFDVATGRLLSETDQAGAAATPSYATTLAYDASGKLTTVTDPAGRAYTFTWTGTHITSVSDGGTRRIDYAYSTAGDLTDVYGTSTVRSGSTLGNEDRTQLTYDTHHLMVTIRTPKNFGVTATPTPVTTNVYDTSQRVTSQTDPLGRVTTFVYGPAGGLATGQTKVTDPAGHVTLDTYQSGLLVSETRGYGTPDAGTWSYAYDPLTLGVSVATDPDGHTTTYAYDDHGNRISSSDALGRATSYQWDDAGHPVLTTDPSGTQTAVAYNAAGQVTATSVGRPGQTAEVSDGNPVDPTVRTTSNTYADAAHPADVTTSTDPRGKFTTYTYDTAGNLTKTTDPLGRSTLARYDARTGWLLATVTPRGVAAGTTATCTPPAAGCATTTYDAHGRVLSTKDAAGHTASATYDADGRQLTSTDANNHTTTTTYDAAGQVTSVKAPNAGVTGTTYAGDGQVATTVDPAGKITAYAYDAQGRRTTSTDPDNRTTTSTFDPAGLLTTLKAPDATISTYAYDAAGELTGITYSSGLHAVTYAYDVAGRRTTATDGTGTSTTTYDAFGEPLKITDGSGATVAYTYDEAGDVTSIQYPGTGRTVTRTFDDARQLTAVKDWNAKTTSFGYDADGSPTTTTYPNGTVSTTVRDTVGLASSTTLKKSTTTLAALTYTRDASGNLTGRTPSASAPGVAQTFGYDASNQVTSATGAPAGTFTYDVAGHPTALAGTTQTFDAAGTLCWTATTGTGTCAAPPAGATVYGSDADGRRTTVAKNGTTSATYTWNQAGELTGATTPTGSATYAYDADGLRVSTTTGGTTSHATWDRAGGLPLLVDDGTTAYVYGPGGLPVEQVGASATQWFFADAQGSTVALVDSSGAVVGTYGYDTWGRTVSHTGTASTVMQYVGQVTDALTGLIYLRARYYDPATAVFLSIDPLVVRTLSPYLYVANNPLNAWDPTGLINWGLTLGAISAVTGIAAVVVAALAPATGGTSLLVAGVLEGISIGTGVAATIIDCRHGMNVSCGIDIAATALGVGGGVVRGIGLAGKLAKPTAEAVDTVAGTWGAHLGLAGTIAGVGESLTGKEGGGGGGSGGHACMQ
jgi:RHS repeat-associated protein